MLTNMVTINLANGKCVLYKTKSKQGGKALTRLLKTLIDRKIPFAFNCDIELITSVNETEVITYN